MLIDKVGLSWRTPHGRPFREVDGRPIYRNLQPASLREELTASLQRLRTDYLDLCLVCFPDPLTPIAETMEELMRWRATGRIRAIGVGNVSAAQLQEYLAAGKIDAVAQTYNLLDRRMEQTLVPLCQARGLAVLAYAPLGQGLLTGMLQPRQSFAFGDMRALDARFSAEAIARTNALLERFASLRRKYGLNQTQLTLAWTIGRAGISCALAGVKRAGQVEDLLAGCIDLLPEDVATMDQLLADWEASQTRTRAA